MTLKLIFVAGMLVALAGCVVGPYGPGVQSGQNYYNPDAQYNSFGNPGSANPGYVDPAYANSGYGYASPGYAPPPPPPPYGYYAPYSR